MATATTHHYATVNPYTGEVVREFDSLDAAAVERGRDRAPGLRGPELPKLTRAAK
jgi:hypothetical protein